ncbi:hypothetical protein RJT34_11855 [Clitoria ternatea]|uniref:Uncharacterized protein n=1 Tax=Clitoria ternatea TaxID=43366 RepID=A0AAN9JML2_CLITE
MKDIIDKHKPDVLVFLETRDFGKARVTLRRRVWLSGSLEVLRCLTLMSLPFLLKQVYGYGGYLWLD